MSECFQARVYVCGCVVWVVLSVWGFIPSNFNLIVQDSDHLVCIVCVFVSAVWVCVCACALVCVFECVRACSSMRRGMGTDSGKTTF